MAARIRKATKKGSMPDDWKAKIQASQIVNRLMLFVNGKIDLVPAQVTAASILLKKVAPDMASIEHSGAIAMTHENALAALEDDGSTGA